MRSFTADELNNLDELPPAQEHNFLSELFSDDGSEVRRHLAEGRPIYYANEDTPGDCVIKKYPDGKIELIAFQNGVEILVDQPSA